MPDLRVSDVTARPEQPAGQPFPVTVALNNLETVAFSWEASTCNVNGEYGHKATVTVTVRDSGGDVVADPSRDVCIPRNRAGQIWGPNLREEFDITLPEPGDYTVRASVDAREAVGGDRSAPVGVTAVDSGEVESVNDDGSGAGSGTGIDFGDGSGDGGAGGSVDKALLVVGLLAVAWIASSGSDIAEVFD
jgi:hypothetical protein